MNERLLGEIKLGKIDASYNLLNMGDERHPFVNILTI